ncbi:MAG: serine/threonine protein kinase [Pyrinomonadaceae bacterium]|nr:serine/threonine protein kinase [Pyrinomonadaceae bacterium]
MKLAHLVGEVLDEKYRIERQLGQGGMGAVFLATHLGTERPVALKVITPEFMRHGEFVERFRREARAAGRLRHPNVVDVTDFGFGHVGAKGERVAYLVMEYLDGCTLAEVLSEEERLPVGWVVDILEQTCSAVDEAHQQGIVHRDLKPDNIWLEPNRRGGYTVKVLDFGIARLGDSAQGDENKEPESFAASASATPSASFSLESPTLIPSSGKPRKAADSDSQSEASGSGSGAKPGAEFTESPTVIRAPSSVTDDDEDEASSTRMLPSSSRTPAEEGTRILDKHTTNKQQGATTAVDERLTRIGSILGTPLYMSPEQCRGETSDARSDIYSLGVIGYQMLVGRTPFNGNMETVIQQHMTAEPPPIEEKRIPKKVAGVIMSALAKNPAERPETAAAFASSLRAHSAGTGELLRRALALFSEHLPVFLRLALIVYSPLILFSILLLVEFNLYARKVIGPVTHDILNGCINLLNLVVAFFVGATIISTTTRLVTQMLAAPLRPLRLRPVFRALRKRLKPLMGATVAFSLMAVLGFVLCFFPMLYVMMNYYLVTPIVMMEGKRGRAAFRRAKELSARSRRTVVTVMLLQVAAPFVVSSIMAFLAFAVVKAFNPTGLRVNTFNNIFHLMQMPITLLLGSFGSVVTALLYWKTRLAGGETMREAFLEFQEEDLPDRNWQKRMRDRLHLTTRLNRSDGGRSRLDR